MFIMAIKKGELLFDGVSVLGSESGVREIVLQEDIFSVSEKAFKDNDTIESFTAKCSVGLVDAQSFENCKNLKYAYFKDVSMILFDAFKDCSSLEKIDFGSSLRFISNSAFENCSSLQEIKIPITIEDIGINAFKNCKSLKRVDIRSTLGITLEDFVFEGCESLEDVTLGRGVVMILDSFEGVDMSKITFHIERDSFAEFYVKGCGYKYDYIE